jgi:hypothetical protein
MGDRSRSLTTSMPFDIRIGVIRDYSRNCQTTKIFVNRKILKILKNKFCRTFSPDLWPPRTKGGNFSPDCYNRD